MRLDQLSKNIFYYSSKNIWIINEISKYTKILYDRHIILNSYIIANPVRNNYCFDFLSIKGEKKSILCYDAPINAVAHDSENKHYVIFMDGFISRVDYDYELIEKVKAGVSQDILEAYVNGNQIYLKKKWINHITCGYFHFVQKTGNVLIEMF
ncbi:hypothetical protein HZS_1508 [Henneguya salminicola]|nr:hypothetical protein HZS_1508 [Henneguya salminicola]